MDFEAKKEYYDFNSYANIIAYEKRGLIKHEVSRHTISSGKQSKLDRICYVLLSVCNKHLKGCKDIAEFRAMFEHVVALAVQGKNINQIEIELALSVLKQ